jgi:hypothetical protein
MENPSIHHDLGRHDAQIEQLQADMRAMKEDVHEIKMILSEARGGWKTLMLVGGIAAAVGATVSKLAGWLGWMPK